MEHGTGVEAKHRLCSEYDSDFKVRRGTNRSNLFRHKTGQEEQNNLAVGT